MLRLLELPFSNRDLQRYELQLAENLHLILTVGKVASLSSRFAKLEQAIPEASLKFIFTKLTYPAGPSLTQPYLPLALALPALSLRASHGPGLGSG